jgi:hypothetical protein
MKSSKRSNLELKKYKLLGFFILIVSITYILSDFVQWYLNKDRFILDLNQMPLYRRLLTDFYIMLFGYGGYLLIRDSPKSWYLIIISMTSIIPSFIIISLVWNISFYTNWIEDLPFLLWYLFSAIIVIVFIIKRKDFGINNWIGRLTVILLINIGIRILHEVIMFNATNA